jgi:hypothetical protein
MTGSNIPGSNKAKSNARFDKLLLGLAAELGVSAADSLAVALAVASGALSESVAVALAPPVAAATSPHCDALLPLA